MQELNFQKEASMRKLLIIVASLLVMAGVAGAEDFVAEKKAGDLMVKVSIGNNPLSVGPNDTVIEIHDGAGHAVTDAEVNVYWFMPSMPAMNYEVKADLQDNKYVAVIKPTMPGEWDADIKVKRKTGDQQKATISFEAK
jgi:hypothetical protein